MFYKIQIQYLWIITAHKTAKIMFKKKKDFQSSNLRHGDSLNYVYFRYVLLCSMRCFHLKFHAPISMLIQFCQIVVAIYLNIPVVFKKVFRTYEQGTRTSKNNISYPLLSTKLIRIKLIRTFSLSESNAEVASSKSIIFGSLINARATATRCFCPPDMRVPFSPTIVSYPCQCTYKICYFNFERITYWCFSTASQTCAEDHLQ